MIRTAERINFPRRFKFYLIFSVVTIEEKVQVEKPQDFSGVPFLAGFHGFNVLDVTTSLCSQMSHN